MNANSLNDKKKHRYSFVNYWTLMIQTIRYLWMANAIKVHDLYLLHRLTCRRPSLVGNLRWGWGFGRCELVVRRTRWHGSWSFGRWPNWLVRLVCLWAYTSWFVDAYWCLWMFLDVNQWSYQIIRPRHAETGNPVLEKSSTWETRKAWKCRFLKMRSCNEVRISHK